MKILLKKKCKKLEKYVIEFCITGIKHQNYTFQEDDLKGKLQLVADPLNQYDSKCINVILNGKQIGYIRKNVTDDFHTFFETLNNEPEISRWKMSKCNSGYMVVQGVFKDLK